MESKPMVIKVIAQVKVSNQRSTAERDNNYDVTFRSIDPSIMLGAMIDPKHDIELTIKEIIPTFEPTMIKKEVVRYGRQTQAEEN